MIRLSRTGWNNLIIFAMLFMIFLFNGLHHKLLNSNAEEGERALLPLNSLVLTIEFDSVKVERIGKGWRTTGVDTVDLAGLVNSWQSQLMVPMNDTVPSEKVLTHATFWLAGLENGYTFSLHQYQSEYYLFDRDKQIWYALPVTLKNTLFPFYSSN